MALYLISYDIKKNNEEEYEPLYKKLEALGATKILLSEWVLVDKVGQAAAIYDAIFKLLLKTDRLLVQELTKDAKWDQLLISDDEFQTFLKKARG